MWRLCSIPTATLLFIGACTPTTTEPPTGTDGYRLELEDAVVCEDPVPSDQPLPYTDTTAASGLSYAAATPSWDQAQNGYSSVDVENGGGIAVVDLNMDRALDVLIMDHDSPPRVFFGDGASGFTETSATALGIEVDGAYLIGVSAADINGDDLADILLLSNGPNLMFINEGDGSFSDQSIALGLSGPEVRSLSAAWADPDRDGDLDVIVVNHGRGSFSPEDDYPPQQDQFFIQSAGTFTDRIDLLYPDPSRDGYGFAVGWFDANDDGLIDLYVVNDLATGEDGNPPNFFAQNTTSAASAEPSFAIAPQSHLDRPMLAMGLAIGDMDTDGDLDLHVSNAGRSFLARNDGDLSFVDRSLALAGLSESPRGDISWSTEFFDYDNDGRLELFCSFGHMPSKADQAPNDTANVVNQHDALWARDDDGSFRDIAASVGIDSPLSTRTVVAADLDGNGFLDLITWALFDGPRIYRARCNTNAWLIVALDVPGSLNRDAIGARIEAWADGELLGLREMVAGSSGALSSGPPEVHFGLAQHQDVELRIRWPQGGESVHSRIPTRRRLRIVQDDPL